MNNEHTSQFLQAALQYYEAGFSVIPIRSGSKAPMVSGWQRYSSERASREQIIQWWTERPNANVGIALGPANSTDGRYLFVVDQDILKGEDGMPALDADGNIKKIADISGCPATLSQTTGSGGRQHFYWAPEGYQVGNSKPRELMDVKGFGGQVLVPPSVHPVTGNVYAWNADDLSRDFIVEFPQDALDALLSERGSSASSAGQARVKQVLKGVPVGQGLRHIAAAQVAGFYLRGARSQEEIDMARVALYAWDREMNKSPEPWVERRRELDDTFDGILKRERETRAAMSRRSKGDTLPVQTRAVVARFDSIHPEKMQWLWPDRVALGKLTLIAGDPGLGKSLITASMAAVVSSGSSWPVDNMAAQVGDVVILSAEDDPADTIRPRLDAAGADVRRVHIIKAVADEQPGGGEQTRSFSLRKDLSTLAEVVESLENCRLVIIDPISAYLGDVDSHNNAEVRGLLAPLSELASRCKVAIVAVSHLNKNSAASAMYRTMGSLAFVAAARASYAVVKDSKDPRRRLMVPVKNNLGADDTGYAYVVESTENGAPVVAWDKALVPVPSDLSSGDTKELEDQADRDWATSVLEVILSKGPVPATRVYEEGKQAGLTAKQLMRIAHKLGVIRRKISFDGGWVWELQKQASGQDEGYEALAESARETVLDGDMPVKEQGAQDVEDTGPGAETEGKDHGAI